MATSKGTYRLSPPTLANGDQQDFLLSSTGALVVSSGGTGASSDQVQGNVANGVADAGNPVKIGGYANSTIPTTVTTGQRVNAWMSLNGALNTVARAPDSLATNQATIATTATQIAAARSGRGSITITNLGTTDVFIGLAGVTTATGLLLAGVKGTAITVHYNGAIYGIVGTGTQAVSYAETY